MTEVQFTDLYNMVQAYSMCGLMCLGYLMGVR